MTSFFFVLKLEKIEILIETKRKHQFISLPLRCQSSPVGMKISDLIDEARRNKERESKRCWPSRST